MVEIILPSANYPEYTGYFKKREILLNLFMEIVLQAL